MAEHSVVHTITDSQTQQADSAILSSAYAVFDQVSDAIVLLDLRGACIFMNVRAEYLFHTRGQQFGETVTRQLLDAKTSEFSLTTVTSDGNEVRLHVVSSPIAWLGTQALLFTAREEEGSANTSSHLEKEVARTTLMLEEILTSIDEVLLSLSSDLTIVDVTPSIRRITHHSVEHYLGGKLGEYIHSDDKSHLRHLQQNGANEHIVQLRLYASDGSYRWMRCRFYRDTHGSSAGIVSWKGVLRDITDVKQFEKALALTEQKYRTIFETSKTALVLFNADQTIALVNAETEHLSGYTAAELTDGHRWLDHVAEHDKERLNQYHTARGKDPSSVPDVYEFQLVRKDGQHRDVLCKVARIPGTEQGVTSFVDITESKYKTSMYKTIIEQSLFGVMIVERFTVKFANEHAGIICGYRTDELRQLPADGILSIINDEQKPAVVEAFESVMLGRVWQKRLLMRIIRKDGTVATIDSFFSSIEYEGKKSVLLLGLDVTDRTTMLEQLREGEQRYKIFSEVISDYAYTQVFLPGGGWKTEWVSETISNMVSDSMELEHFSWDPYVLNEDVQALGEHRRRILRGESDVAEFRIRKPEGRTIWVREYCRPIVSPETGEVQRVYAVGQDITERRTMRQALHEFERRFRLMLEHLSMISLILDVHGKLAFCNDYLLNLTGFSREDILSINWFDTFLPDDNREQHRAVFERMVETGDYPVNFEYEIITHKGERRLISWSNTIMHDTQGKIIGSASIGEDITDRRFAERKLRESEERYRQLFTIEPDALIVHTLDDKEIIEANDAALDLYGFTRDEIEGMYMPDLSAEPEQTIKAIDVMRTQKRHKVPLRYHKRKDGTVFACEISSGTFVHEHRELVYASIRDISERVRSERLLIEAKEQAELADKLKDSFIANMSHEIRTPLNIILGYTGIIESELADKLDEEQLDYFRSVERSGARLQRTVEQLLNLSSLQVGTYSSKSEEFDLCQNVDNLVYEMVSLAHAKNIALEVIHEQSSLPVNADRYLVDQALANILDNAIKFTQEGGVFVRVQAIEHFARIEVRDTGIGIAKEYLPRIFSMFSQEVLGYTRPFDGLGIGLALTKMYMTEIGGEVNIASTKGEGTIVTLEIPLSGAVRSAGGLLQEAGQSYGIRKHVLLIEDDALTQKYMTIALQGAHNITFAESTEEALNILTNSPVDIILLDLNMKGTYDGLNTAKTIKSNSSLAHIPIVVVTAHEKPEDRRRCTEAGCNEFLVKPLRRVELEETIARLTRR